MTCLGGVDKVELEIYERIHSCLIGKGQLVGDPRLHLLSCGPRSTIQKQRSLVVQNHDIDLWIKGIPTPNDETHRRANENCVTKEARCLSHPRVRVWFSGNKRRKDHFHQVRCWACDHTATSSTCSFTPNDYLDGGLQVSTRQRCGIPGMLGGVLLVGGVGRLLFLFHEEETRFSPYTYGDRAERYFKCRWVSEGLIRYSDKRS